MHLPSACLNILAASLVMGCQSGTSPIERSLAEDVADEYPGLPEEWVPMLGIDDWEAPGPMDWEEHLKGGGYSGGQLSTRKGEAALFEVRFIDGDTSKRWYVLVQPDPGPERTSVIAQVTLTPTDGGREFHTYLLKERRLVTVAADGREERAAREVFLPSFPPHLGYSVGSALGLVAAFERLQEAGEITTKIEHNLAITYIQPNYALLALFNAFQTHEELFAILRQVVETPSLLSIVMNGGIEITIEADTKASETLACPIGRGRTVMGVHFPAHIDVNGKPGLELDIYATDAVRPFHLTGGLIGLRATMPGEDSKFVELRLIGARDLTGSSDGE